MPAWKMRAVVGEIMGLSNRTLREELLRSGSTWSIGYFYGGTYYQLADLTADQRLAFVKALDEPQATHSATEDQK